MRIAITASGSRGDMQPYIALGSRLKTAGHEVVLTGPQTFAGLVRDRGLLFHPLPLDPQEAVRQQLKKGDANLLEFARRSRGILEPLMKEDLRHYLEACEGADAVIYTTVGFLGYSIARALGIPRVGALLGPFISATRFFPSSWIPVPSGELALDYARGIRGPGPIRQLYNLLSYKLSQQVLWQFIRGPVNEALRDAGGLSPLPFSGPFAQLRRSREPILHGWSRHVVPHPPDWGAHLPVTGYWFLDRPEDFVPPEGLEDFLDSGPPPVSVGFGSMGGARPEETTGAVLTALKKTGRRGVLLTGWGGISNADLPDDVFKVDEAPHDWLFPRVAAAVHHGGAGTTGASLRAGVPTVVVPFFADQWFWGARVAGLGVGPRSIPRARLSAERLAGAIDKATTDIAIGERARLLGEKIRSEDGLDRAVREFHRLAGKIVRP